MTRVLLLIKLIIKAYLTEDLRINILIKINILDIKSFIINFIIYYTFITSYNIILLIIIILKLYYYRQGYLIFIDKKIEI